MLIVFKAQAQTSILIEADSLYNNGNFTKAITTYKRHNTQKEVYDKIAKAYVNIGNYGEALTYYKKSVDAYPKDALLKYDYAKLLSKTKKFDEASVLFNDLVYIDYKNPNYHYELGLVLEELNDSTAMNRYRSAYDLDQTHQKAIYKIAKHYLTKRKHTIAESYINKGLESYAENLELISLKAQNYYWEHEYAKAIIWFEKLIALGETSEFIHEKLSLCYAQESNYEKAIEHRKKALKFNPLDANAMYVIGTYYEHLQDFKNAETFVKQSLLLRDIPLDDDYVKLGTIYNRQDKYKEAIDAFNIALKENPENVNASFFQLISKDKYYKDIDTKINLYDNFIERYAETPYANIAKMRLQELKEEKFLQEDETKN